MSKMAHGRYIVNLNHNNFYLINRPSRSLKVIGNVLASSITGKYGMMTMMMPK